LSLRKDVFPQSQNYFFHSNPFHCAKWTNLFYPLVSPPWFSFSTPIAVKFTLSWTRSFDMELEVHQFHCNLWVSTKYPFEEFLTAFSVSFFKISRIWFCGLIDPEVWNVRNLTTIFLAIFLKAHWSMFIPGLWN
jgi:hypothetical protein